VRLSGWCAGWEGKRIDGLKSILRHGTYKLCLKVAPGEKHLLVGDKQGTRFGCETCDPFGFLENEMVLTRPAHAKRHGQGTRKAYNVWFSGAGLEEKKGVHK